jgi:7-cyano-7-deazaguanine synthase
MAERKAVVLLSGGLDSATVAAIARSQGFTLYALTFDYGQRHRIEIEKAAVVAKHHLPLVRPRLGGSARRARCVHRRERARRQRLSGLPSRVRRGV